MEFVLLDTFMSAISVDFKEIFKNISQKFHWYILSRFWCGMNWVRDEGDVHLVCFFLQNNPVLTFLTYMWIKIHLLEFDSAIYNSKEVIKIHIQG